MSDGNTFIREDPWRIFRIMSEFVDSFQTMSQVGPAVTIFGSARVKPKDKYYRAAVAIAKGLAKHNLAVVTGGWRLGMMTARPNWRAVCGTTAAMGVPSRTCRCQSSGRFRVRVSVIQRFSLPGGAGRASPILTK